ncbi:hypothetical protein C8J55DRAFT_582700 [Lentinula edodes]|uniref:Uncharacterized protein n=1 Tax=Lentinula lateritia TaxID=40482 RepID=A0A9W9A0Y3_9AGAR|nr:hypothetical protein C8J55DRAFT_582700 [Lentinula edodes]
MSNADEELLKSLAKLLGIYSYEYDEFDENECTEEGKFKDSPSEIIEIGITFYLIKWTRELIKSPSSVPNRPPNDAFLMHSFWRLLYRKKPRYPVGEFKKAPPNFQICMKALSETLQSLHREIYPNYRYDHKNTATKQKRSRRAEGHISSPTPFRIIRSNSKSKPRPQKRRSRAVRGVSSSQDTMINTMQATSSNYMRNTRPVVDGTQSDISAYHSAPQSSSSFLGEFSHPPTLPPYSSRFPLYPHAQSAISSTYTLPSFSQSTMTYPSLCASGSSTSFWDPSIGDIYPTVQWPSEPNPYYPYNEHGSDMYQSRYSKQGIPSSSYSSGTLFEEGSSSSISQRATELSGPSSQGVSLFPSNSSWPSQEFLMESQPLGLFCSDLSAEPSQVYHEPTGLPQNYPTQMIPDVPHPPLPQATSQSNLSPLAGLNHLVSMGSHNDISVLPSFEMDDLICFPEADLRLLDSLDF